FLIGAIVVMLRDTPGAQELVASTDQNFLVYAIIQSFTFTAGIAVVLTGVRMFIGEIVTAFKGIDTKLVPGAKNAIDDSIVFYYEHNSDIIVFIDTFIVCLFWL